MRPGVQQLRYQEFDELLSIIQRVAHRRQILANHVAVRHCTESLRECDEFHAICNVLQRALEPSGFDGIRLQMLNPNGFSASSFHPLHYESEGNLLFSWSECGTGEPPWELRLELVTSSHTKWGYLTLMRMSDAGALLLDVNLLTEEFRTSLSNAMDRACTRLEASARGEDNHRENRTQKAAAGSMTD